MIDRRVFLGAMGSLPLLAAGKAAAATLPNLQAPRAFDAEALHRYRDGTAGRSLRLLVLGGGVFLGPAVIRYALDRGHRVTVFNRGQSNPGLFPQVESRRGDRLDAVAGLDSLREGTWDAVIDTWSGDPAAVERSLAALAGRYGRYAYVSSISVYGRDNYRMPEVTEEAQLPTPPPERRQPGPGGQLPYAVRKLDADRAVQRAAGDAALVFRPHQIVGRWIAAEGVAQCYWPARLDEGGEILAPGDGLDHMQYVDVADLGRFIVRACENGERGVFNTCRRIDWREFLYGIRALTTTADVRLRWTPSELLRAHDIRPFAQMPGWVPRQDGPGFQNHRAEKAIAAGLGFRPFAQTYGDVLACTRQFFGAGFRWGEVIDTNLLTRAREREVLAALRSETLPSQAAEVSSG